MKGEGDPGGEQTGGGQKGHGRDTHHLEGVDLVRDPHGAQFRDDLVPTFAESM